MTRPHSIVGALVALGLDESDAWRCVHLLQSQESFVLLESEPVSTPGSAAIPCPFDEVELEQLAAVADHGAAWSADGDGRWKYLRRLDLDVRDFDDLHRDLLRLAELTGPRP